MDFTLVGSLLCVLIFSGLNRTAETEPTDVCPQMCPPGYYNHSKCQNTGLNCKPCQAGTYTAISNSITKCLRCKTCGNNEVEAKPCAAASDRTCDCQPGYYRHKNPVQCVSCKSRDFAGSDEDYKKKCIQSGDPEHTTVTTLAPNSPRAIIPIVPVNYSVTPVASGGTEDPVQPSPSTSAPVFGTQSSNSSSNSDPPNQNMWIWFYFMFAATTFLAFCWILVLISKQGSCFCWSLNKYVETPAQEANFNEQHSRQCSSPTTLKFTVCEETSIVSLCKEPPAHISSQSPDIVPFVHREDEQSDRWPAIVLYAIIKEVPLRRWKEFLRLLSVSDQQMERVELEAGLGLLEKQYQMLRLWSQTSSASLNDVYLSLRLMDLSGCAQLLQENLEKLKLRVEVKQGLTV